MKINYAVFINDTYEYICSTNQHKTLKAAIASTIKSVGDGKTQPNVGIYNGFDRYLRGNGPIVQTGKVTFKNDKYDFIAFFDKE